LRKQGHTVVLERANQRLPLDLIKWADIIICQMFASNELIAQWKKMGKKIVYESDDYIESVPKTHSSYHLTQGWKGIKRRWKTHKAMKLSDGMFVSTPTLLEAYKKYQPKAVCFPNYLWLEHWQSQKERNYNGEKIRLGWAGSLSHQDDLEFVSPILAKVLADSANVKFIYIGQGGFGTGSEWLQYVRGKDFFKEIPNERKEFLKGVSSDIWGRYLSTLQLDIGIAPLVDSPFVRGKSTCKYLEYSVNRIAGVYQRFLYGSIVKDGITGLLADTPEEWVTALEYLIKNPEKRKEIAENAYNDVIQNHNIDNHLERWYNTFKEFTNL